MCGRHVSPGAGWVSEIARDTSAAESELGAGAKFFFSLPA
jgi:hypothetical protein